MTDSAGELVVIRALVERFERQRLPRLLAIRKRLAQGEVLGELDVDFLAQVFHEATQSKRLMDRHPEWHQFCSEVIHLYKEIMAQAVENEKKS